MSRLTQGEKIAGAAALLLVILSFFPLWAKVEVDAGGLGIGGFSQRFNAWSGAYNFLWVKLPVLLAIVLVAFVIMRAVGSDVSLPVAPGMIYAGIGALSALLLLIGVIAGTTASGLEVAGVEISRGPLLFVGLLCGIAEAAGGWMHMQEEGTGSSTGPVTPTPPAAPPPTPPAS